jgi:hypothetical protein
MSEIALQGVTKNWGAAHAVKGIDFHVKSGSFVVLLGPSGCGKSTTLRLISGLDTPSSGTIRIGDRDVTHLPPAQRKIAMVFQSYALFPHLNVRENILFGVRVRKEPSRDFESRLKRVADILGLAHLLDRRPSQLSGGQQQRVGHPRDPRSGMRARHSPQSAICRVLRITPTRTRREPSSQGISTSFRRIRCMPACRSRSTSTARAWWTPGNTCIRIRSILTTLVCMIGSSGRSLSPAITFLRVKTCSRACVQCASTAGRRRPTISRSWGSLNEAFE